MQTVTDREQAIAEMVLCYGYQADESDPLAENLHGFLYFLGNYVYILDPPPGEGVAKWQPWPYLLELATDLVREKKLVILKARQLGISWLVAAYVLWMAMFRIGAKALLLSQGEKEATELRRKAWFIWKHLPEWMQITADKNNDSALEFGGNNSGIQAFPSTENAGSGFTGSIVVTDEHSKHPHAADNFGTVKPTIDAGGQFISMSTASYLTEGSFFHNLFQAAREGTNGFAWRFLGALLRPGRDEAWYTQMEIESSGDPLTRLTFHQEYPLTIDEAFIHVAGIPVFDPDALRRLDAEKRPFIQELSFPLGHVRVWQMPVVGRFYVAGADVSYGLGSPDSACCQVLDWRTGNHVATLYGKFPPEELIDRAVNLCKLYNNAFLGVEENGVGQFAIRRLEQTNYRNVFYRDWEESQINGKRPEKLGWHTGQNRDILISELSEALRGGEITTWDESTIKELWAFVHFKGKQQAAAGMHDDRVMSLGIAWQMRGLPFIAARAAGVVAQGKNYAGIGRSL